VEPQKVTIKVRGCGAYFVLDTDFNLPNADFTFSNFYVTYPKDPNAGDLDPCRTASNIEYELRRSTINNNIYFNIYPSAGDGPYIIFI